LSRKLRCYQLYNRRLGKVVAVRRQGDACELLEVLCEKEKAQALNYVPLTGQAQVGDQVVLNTTAVDLELGTGGLHFVCLNLSRLEADSQGPGHIMKLRYTPQQVRVLAVEEEVSPYHAVMKKAKTLLGMPVMVAELHSMLAPAAIALKQKKPHVRLAYVMTDGGALPAFFSKTVRQLQERGFICGTITTGHAFGGDLEAVNVYSGLLAAKHVLQADTAMICMGPGVVGTGTPFGFSGLELGDNVNRVASLGGYPIAVPRISFADKRPRHRGLSHHTLTALTVAALVAADLPLPVLAKEKNDYLWQQITASGLKEKHAIYAYEGLSLSVLAEYEDLCCTMGRGLAEDPEFFLAVVAAAHHTALILEKISESVAKENAAESSF